MSYRRNALAALLALVFARLGLLQSPAWPAATIDRAVCSTADKSGGDPSSCSATELIDATTQEIAKLYQGNILVVQSVSGTNTITGSTSPAATALVDGEMRQIKPANTNTGAATYNDNGLGAKQLVSAAGSALSSGDLQSSTFYILRYYSANDEWRVLSPLGTGGSAPSTPSYVTLGLNATLASERVLTAGTALGLTDGGANSTITVALTDAELTCLAALTSAADKVAYYTGSGTCALADLSSYARTLIDDGSASAARTTLGLVLGTDVQAYDADLAALAANSTTGFWAYTGAGTGAARTLSAPAAGLTITNPAGTAGNPTFALANDLAALEALSGTSTIYYRSGSDTWSAVTIGGLLSFSGGTLNVGDAELAALAGLTSAADALPYFTGSGIAGTTTLTTFGRSLIDDAAASNARTTLGLVPGTDVQAYNARLADIAGITWDQGDILYFNGTNLVDLGPGTSGQFLKTNGAGANPAWATLAGGGDLLSTNNLSDVANAATARSNLGLAIGTTVQAYDADLTTWAGVTPSANAQSLVTAADYSAMRTLLSLVPGTDVQAYNARLANIAGITWDQGDILYFNGTNLVDLGPGTSGQFLKTNGAGANPAWATLAGGGDLLSTNNLSDVANAATARTNLGLGTGNTPQFTGVEIGNASDTTLARVSGGVASIEGKSIALNGTGETWTTGTIELGNASDTTIARTSAGLITVEGKKLSPTESFCVAASDETTALTTGTAKVTFRMPYAFTLTSIRASLNTVSSSGLPAFDVNEEGVSVFSTTLTVDASEKTSTTAATAAVISDTSLADDAEMTIDIDTAGTGAKGAKICLIGYQT